MKKKYFSILFIVLISWRLTAQEWVVPAENNARLSPFAFSDSTQQAGAILYSVNCKSCHGDPGKNNVINLVPPPVDPASEKMQSNPDGALFFKIFAGHGQMPSFKNILSSAEIWKVVSYIRSFNQQYVQKIATANGKALAAENVKILITWLKDKNQVQTVTSGKKNNAVQPIGDAEIKLFAKRYFGNLIIDEVRNTDSQGKALFNLPVNLPGDSAGMVQLVAQLSDEEAFGDAKTDTVLAVGIPTYRLPLNEPRSMWNVVWKAPIWLLFSYFFSVILVWGFIIYVLLQIRNIYKAGISRENDHKV